MKQWGPSTSAVHSGAEVDASTGAIIQPIHMSSVYVQPEPGEFKYDYGRSMNPDFYPLEAALAALEHADHATVVSSGVGAMSCLLGLLDETVELYATKRTTVALGLFKATTTEALAGPGEVVPSGETVDRVGASAKDDSVKGMRNGAGCAGGSGLWIPGPAMGGRG